MALIGANLEEFILLKDNLNQCSCQHFFTLCWYCPSL